MEDRNSLYEQLKDYSESDYYPFHMPGHKRKIRPFEDLYGIDITEIEGFDNLHHAEGILLEAQKRAAKLYHSEKTFFLVNGSSGGILAAAASAVPRNGKILIARNCHKAVYHAVLLNNLEAAYVYPQVDMARGITGAADPEEIMHALGKDPDISAVLITSPTYDGVVSDVRKIAQIVHDYGKVLIVDEAHGAHFGMHADFPEHSLSCGADIVINSAHKTLPALTQTAFLHVQGTRVDRDRLKKYLGIYQTSSPSYVLMAGLDSCVRILQTKGPKLFDPYVRRLKELRARLTEMKLLHLLNGTEQELYCYDYDCSKIVITTERAGITGTDLAALLRNRYHLEMEMASEYSVTAITTTADTDSGFDRLQTALTELDLELYGKSDVIRSGFNPYEKAGTMQHGSKPYGAAEQKKENENILPRIINKSVMRIAEAEESAYRTVMLEESGGSISAEFVYLYPPGIPLVTPGERISEELLSYLLQVHRQGLKLQGMTDYTAETIRIISAD